MGVVLYKGDNTLMEQKSKDVVQITHKKFMSEAGVQLSDHTCAQLVQLSGLIFNTKTKQNFYLKNSGKEDLQAGREDTGK